MGIVGRKGRPTGSCDKFRPLEVLTGFRWTVTDEYSTRLVYNCKSVHIYPWQHRRLAPFESLQDGIIQMHCCKGVSPFVRYLYTSILHGAIEAHNQRNRNRWDACEGENTVQRDVGPRNFEQSHGSYS